VVELLSDKKDDIENANEETCLAIIVVGMLNLKRLCSTSTSLRSYY
jgi:hypothetical protein